ELPDRAQCTVFLSSHQLDEVEKVASHLALLDRGCVRFQSKLEDIYALSEGALSLELDCTKIAGKLLEAHHFKIEIESKTRLKVRHISRENAHQVHACIVNANLRLHLSTFETPSLEHWFHQQTHGNT
ncbi:MAG: hypothetical protein Q8Q55_01480, partial [Undibacterium sp.]|nr:hypothetical protein [Undibacterium sp.]